MVGEGISRYDHTHALSKTFFSLHMVLNLMLDHLEVVMQALVLSNYYYNRRYRPPLHPSLPFSSLGLRRESETKVDGWPPMDGNWRPIPHLPQPKVSHLMVPAPTHTISTMITLPLPFSHALHLNSWQFTSLLRRLNLGDPQTFPWG